MNITNWEKKYLSDVGTFSKGSGITKNDLVEAGVPCVRYAELYTKYDFVIPHCVSFILEETAKTAKQIQKGDLLFAGSGETKEEIGKCAVYDNEVPAYAGGDNIIFKIEKASPLYLSFYLNTAGRRQLNKLGQGDSIVHIHAKDLMNVQIPLPPLPEQEKIAEILSCWDLGIEKLTALIERKRLQKKGLMQKLLTGKIRLPGFSDKWKKFDLDNCSQIKKGEQLGRSEMDADGIYPVINGGISESGFSNEFNREQNTITISEGGNSCGFVSFMHKKFWSGGHCYTLHELKTDTAFLFQMLKFFENRIMRLRVGSGLPNIQKSSLEKFPLYIPTNIKEQTAIADVLSKADEEIDALNKKRTLLQQQKKGLMQKLLTGQIRVKVA